MNRLQRLRHDRNRARREKPKKNCIACPQEFGTCGQHRCDVNCIFRVGLADGYDLGRIQVWVGGLRRNDVHMTEQIRDSSIPFLPRATSPSHQRFCMFRQSNLDGLGNEELHISSPQLDGRQP